MEKEMKQGSNVAFAETTSQHASPSSFSPLSFLLLSRLWIAHFLFTFSYFLPNWQAIVYLFSVTSPLLHTTFFPFFLIVTFRFLVLPDLLLSFSLAHITWKFLLYWSTFLRILGPKGGTLDEFLGEALVLPPRPRTSDFRLCCCTFLLILRDDESLVKLFSMYLWSTS